MDFYSNVLLKPDLEMPVSSLLNAVYSKCHRGLCDLKSNSIGISFPAYEVLLGDQLRIHGSYQDLVDLAALDWLGGLIGYCEAGQIESVPALCNYRTVSRRQTTMTQAKLRRLIKRGTIVESDIKQYKAKMFTKGLDNPYVELVSTSTGHKHRRHIEFGELRTQPVLGSFDQFGLSKTATVPWF